MILTAPVEAQVETGLPAVTVGAVEIVMDVLTGTEVQPPEFEKV